MSGEEPLTPAFFESLARSYVTRIEEAGDIEVDSVPSFPPSLKPRVEYLLNLE